MKVNRMDTLALLVPQDFPFAGGVTSAGRDTVYLLMTKLTSDDGLEGFGLCFARNESRLQALKACLDSLRELVIGQDIFHGAEAWQKLFTATAHMGHHGYGIYAVSAIDTALWVLKAKALELPLAHLLGGFRDKVPAYASHLLWRSWSIDQLQKDAASLVQQGFRAMKMRMGDRPFKTELERLKAVRQAVGEDIDIMVDINWQWTATQAIKMGREMEKYNAYWLEDPLLSDDPQQLADLTAALDIPVTIGETYCTKYDFRNLIEKRAGDIFMIDLERVGGITEWLKVAAMAQAWNIPVASHLFPDFSVHLVAAIPNGIFVEYMPWWDKIYQEPHRVVDGYIEVPKTPGLGLELNAEAVKRYELK